MPFGTVDGRRQAVAPIYRVRVNRLSRRHRFVDNYQPDDIAVDKALTGILEIDGDAAFYHGLDLANPPFRPIRMTNQRARENCAVHLISDKVGGGKKVRYWQGSEQ